VYGPYYGSDELPGPANPAARLIPTPHKSRYSHLFTSPRLCGSCHDVFSPDGFKIEEAYSEWKNGPYARRGIVCENCHMGPEPGKPTSHDELGLNYIVDPGIFPAAPKRHLSNHRFTGPDYSLLKAFGQADLGLGNDSFARLESHLESERETLLHNAATMRVTHPPQARKGSTLRVAVAVTNAGAGHNLPTGFASERQLWLEVTVTDQAGRRLFSSGDVDQYADLRDYESSAVQDGAVPVDGDLFNLEAAFVLTNFRGTQSNAVSTTNRLLSPVPFIAPPPDPSFLQGMPFAGRVFKEGIPPLKTRTANYAIALPADLAGPVKLSVRLRYRNFPPHFLRDIGVGDLTGKLRTIDLQTYQDAIAVAP